MKDSIQAFLKFQILLNMNTILMKSEQVCDGKSDFALYSLFCDLFGDFREVFRQNSIDEFSTAFFAFLLCFIVLNLLKHLIKNFAIQIVSIFHSEHKIEHKDFVKRMLSIFEGKVFYICLPLVICSYFLVLPTHLQIHFTRPIFFTIFIYYGVQILTLLIDVITHNYVFHHFQSDSQAKDSSHLDASAIILISRIIKGGFYILSFLSILGTLGFDISHFVAGVGLGGLAISMYLFIKIHRFFNFFFKKKQKGLCKIY